MADNQKNYGGGSKDPGAIRDAMIEKAQEERQKGNTKEAEAAEKLAEQQQQIINNEKNWRKKE